MSHVERGSTGSIFSAINRDLIVVNKSKSSAVEVVFGPVEIHLGVRWAFFLPVFKGKHEGFQSAARLPQPLVTGGVEQNLVLCQDGAEQA